MAVPLLTEFPEWPCATVGELRPAMNKPQNPKRPLLTNGRRNSTGKAHTIGLGKTKADAPESRLAIPEGPQTADETPTGKVHTTGTCEHTKEETNYCPCGAQP